MRVTNWRSNLRQVIIDWSHRPLVWGQTDCLQFSAACVQAVTGIDYAAEHRLRYATAAAARDYLKRLGYAAPHELVAAMFPTCPMQDCSSGDLAAFPTRLTGSTVGVVVERVVICMDIRGLSSVPLAAAIWGFSI